MRYLMLIRVGSGMEAVNDKLMAEMNGFVERSKRSGIMVDTGGLQGRESGVTLGLSGGKVTVTDGPFTEANEVVGGFAIIDVNTKQEAIDQAREFLQLHADTMGPKYAAEVEVRQMYSMEGQALVTQ